MSLSRFLKIPDEAFTPWLLHRQVFYYVVDEFHSHIENFSYPDGRDAEKLVQYLIDKYAHKFRMYGSAQELLENVKIFTNFPASLQAFKVENAPYTTPPTIFYSMKNEKFIAKSDIFVIIQNMVIEESDPRDLLLSVAMHLQSEEEKIGDRGEFVRFDEKILEEIEKEIKLVMADKQMLAQQHYYKSRSKNVSFEDGMLIFKAQYPKIDLSKDSEMLKQLRQIHEMCNAGELPANFARVAGKLGLFQHAMGQVIQKRPEMFLPYSVINKNYSNPITVRVFEDGDQRFVLKVELSNALFMKGVISVPLSEVDWSFHTMSMEHVLRNFDIKNIEFIRYPIVRAKHRMVPVKIFNPPTAHFTVLAVDGLFELLREAIFTLKLFQGPKSAPDLLLETTSVFESHQKFPYFLAIEGLNGYLKMWKEKLGNVTKTAVRNAKKDGFTLQNLKNELAHLGLLKTFPDIEKYADVVYSEVVKKKKEEFLRTCDLFDAIEHCQLNCILNMFPELSEFVHNQKGCHRVYGYKCEECEKIQKTGNNAEKNKKKKEKQKQAKLAKKTLEDSESQKVQEDVKTAKENSKVEMDHSKVQKMSEVAPGIQRIPKDVSDSKKNSEAPVAKNEIQKTSDAIVESPESDQKTLGIQNSSNNEQLENLEKELLNLKADHDKILGEKNEEIQWLKSEISACKEDLTMEKIRNQEEIQKKILKNQELQFKIQKLNAKLELKGKMMEQLFEQLANASISEDKNKKKYSNPDTVGSSQEHLDS